MKHGRIATQVRLVLLFCTLVAASGGYGAEPLGTSKAAEPTTRTKELKAGAKRFLLLLTHNAYETDSSRSVFLAGPEVLRGRSYNRLGAYIWLSAEAVERLIDHLHADGFLARAPDANETAKTAPRWPSYTLTVGVSGGPRYRADLGWDEAAATYVDGLAKVLEQDSPKAVAALKAISANVRQRLVAATKPKGGVPDDLARNLDSFFLHLQLVLEPAEVRKYKNLILSVPAFSAGLSWDPNFHVTARITKDDASRIVQHLAAEGFFARCGTVRPFERKVLPHPHGPACVLNISSSQWGFSAENLGWCLETLRRLEALRGELRGDAAGAMDALVNRIAEDHPKWKNAPATQPVSKPADEVPAAGKVDETEAPSAESAGELVLLLSWQDADRPAGVIRLTIENRGQGPVRVIEPPDIRTDGPWWGLGAYDIRIVGPDGKQQSYQCLCPPLPKPPPPPEPPKTVVLLPGRSVGVLVDLHRKSAKPWAVENGKYTITATYEPAKSHSRNLAKDLPLFGKKITSGALTWQNQGGIPATSQGDRAGQRDPKSAKVDAFERGDARIALGMTKAQVKEQLSKGRVQDHKVYCFRKPQPDVFERDVWTLYYGPEVPGMGRLDVLRVTFTNGKASSLESESVLCP